MEWIILPTDLKGDLLKKNRYTISKSFYEAFSRASLKMFISRLHSAVYNLISQWLDIRDVLGGEHNGYWLGKEGLTSNYHILMNNRANFNE